MVRLKVWKFTDELVDASNPAGIYIDSSEHIGKYFDENGWLKAKNLIGDLSSDADNVVAHLVRVAQAGVAFDGQTEDREPGQRHRGYRGARPIRSDKVPQLP